MAQHNMTFNWEPVGTGPYMLTENNPNKEMILQRNPNFHQEYFPNSDAQIDKDLGYTKNSGKTLPLTDKLILSLDKESIPRWNKFLQGYYDRSSISSDSFDQTIKIDEHGKAILTPEMKEKGLKPNNLSNAKYFLYGL